MTIDDLVQQAEILTSGLRTSENEITRIAVNFIIHDYREHGEESILARALKALNE